MQLLKSGLCQLYVGVCVRVMEFIVSRMYATERNKDVGRKQRNPVCTVADYVRGRCGF